MLVAVDTNAVSDYVNDHPAESYAAIGILVLLLILLVLLLIRSRRDKDQTGERLSRRDRRRAQEKGKAEGRTTEMPPAAVQPNPVEGEKPSRKQRRQERKERHRRIAEEKRREEEQDRRAWEEE